MMRIVRLFFWADLAKLSALCLTASLWSLCAPLSHFAAALLLVIMLRQTSPYQGAAFMMMMNACWSSHEDDNTSV